MQGSNSRRPACAPRMSPPPKWRPVAFQLLQGSEQAWCGMHRRRASVRRQHKHGAATAHRAAFGRGRGARCAARGCHGVAPPDEGHRFVLYACRCEARRTQQRAVQLQRRGGVQQLRRHGEVVAHRAGAQLRQRRARQRRARVAAFGRAGGVRRRGHDVARVCGPGRASRGVGWALGSKPARPRGDGHPAETAIRLSPPPRVAALPRGERHGRRGGVLLPAAAGG